MELSLHWMFVVTTSALLLSDYTYFYTYEHFKITFLLINIKQYMCL